MWLSVISIDTFAGIDGSHRTAAWQIDNHLIVYHPEHDLGHSPYQDVTGRQIFPFDIKSKHHRGCLDQGQNLAPCFTPETDDAVVGNNRHNRVATFHRHGYGTINRPFINLGNDPFQTLRTLTFFSNLLIIFQAFSASSGLSPKN